MSRDGPSVGMQAVCPVVTGQLPVEDVPAARPRRRSREVARDLASGATRGQPRARRQHLVESGATLVRTAGFGRDGHALLTDYRDRPAAEFIAVTTSSVASTQWARNLKLISAAV